MKRFILISIVLLFFNTCTKELEIDDQINIPPTKPTVTTTSLTSVTSSSAQLGGIVVSDGGEAITARGVCWSINVYPTVLDNKTIDGAGTGSFSSSITGLSSNTRYYVRAYATNSQGTFYGEHVYFNTLKNTGTYIDSRDECLYGWVEIGDQVWMSENLSYLPSVSPSYEESKTIPLYYVYGYEGTSTSLAKEKLNYSTYGVLYNWPAAMAGEESSNSNPSGVQGVCPSGWHLPSWAEWDELIDYLGGQDIAGGKLKAIGYWTSPNTAATNESGFTALPGSFRHLNGFFAGLNEYGEWWSSTGGIYGAQSYVMKYDESRIIPWAREEEWGFSVRCIKD